MSTTDEKTTCIKIINSLLNIRLAELIEFEQRYISYDENISKVYTNKIKDVEIAKQYFNRNIR